MNSYSIFLLSHGGALPRTADVTLRAPYGEFLAKESHVDQMLRMLTDAEIRQSVEKRVCEERENGWQLAG